MAGSMRGRRVGSSSSTETDRGIREPRQRTTYWCSAGHESTPWFARSIAAPELWTCDTCGNPAGQSQLEPPPALTRTPILKTPLDHVHERRTQADGQQLLDEALERLRGPNAPGMDD